MTEEQPKEATEMALVASRGPHDELIERRLRPGWHPSAMLEKASLMARLLSRLFVRVRFDRRSVDHIRDAASQATIVYVLQQRSLLDYLYFNFAFLAHGLPLARFANGVKTTWFRPWLKRLRTWFQRRYPKGPKLLKATTESGEAALLFLSQRPDPIAEEERHAEPYLRSLIDLASREDGPRILLLPLLLVWEKRSESYHRTLFEGVFGTRQRPRPVRKFFSVLKNMIQSLLRAGSPLVQIGGTVDLKAFLQGQDQASHNERAQALGDRLDDILERERRAIVGPPIKRGSLIVQEILASERVDRAVRKITKEKPEYPWVVKKQAQKQLKEIAANFSLVAIKFLSAVVNPLFDALYRGFEIDREGLEAVREAARTKKRIVIIPSHKSHMDYLIISNVFYQHGLMPPHIAAGTNLSFWPMGPIFRRAGAFFLRRSFAGDELYTAVFTEYLVKILREGFPMEFFIEGTRSRTGKLNRPRFGMLSMIVRAALEDNVDNVVFVPVSVGYERVVEVRSYHKEVLGGEKSSENLSGVLKATKVLRTKYGRVYIELHRPLSLDDYLAEQGMRDDTHKDVLNASVRRLAYRIIDAINAVTTVTPAAIVATALLNTPHKQLPMSDLLAQTGFLVSYLRRCGARLSNSIQSALAEHGLQAGETGPIGTFASSAVMGLALEAVTGEAVELFARAGACKVKGSEGHRSVAIDDDHRLELSYYRNNIVHFFVQDAILATALPTLPSDVIDPTQLDTRILELTRLFKFEFCFPPRDQGRSAVAASLERFEANGWIRRRPDGVLERRRTEQPSVVFFRRLLINWLEAYWLVALCIEELRTEPMSPNNFVKHCLKTGRRLYSQDRLSFYESLSKPTIQDALEVFKVRGVVVSSTADRTKKERDRDLHIGADFLPRDRLRGVRAEIEQFLDTQLPEVEAVEQSGSYAGATAGE